MFPAAMLKFSTIQNPLLILYFQVISLKTVQYICFLTSRIKNNYILYSRLVMELNATLQPLNDHLLVFPIQKNN